ncbi:MAG: HAMP domain-containing sensor histidine kinase [Coriobacteriia bacterium]
MHLTSFRARIFLLAVMFAVLLVGAVSVTTYVVVAEGMSGVAFDTVAQLSRQAAEEVQLQATNAKLSAAQEGLTGAVRDREARRRFFRSIPEMFGTSRYAEGAFAVYDEGLVPVWFSASRAVLPLGSERAETLRRHRVLQTRTRAGSVLSGMFGSADLGVYAVHVPVRFPDGRYGVLDVIYFPVREEATIDAIRRPMAAVALTTMLAAVMMMQLSTGWVLGLIDDLRIAADSVDAGQLDVHLPQSGRNEIGELSRSLNRLIDRLRQRAGAQTRFVADASHELATPVAGIRGYVNILRKWAADDPELRAEALDALDRESGRMMRLTRDLLAAIRGESGPPPRAIRFDVNAVCRAVLSSASGLYSGKALAIGGPGGEPLVLMGDPERIEEALSVLVDNACKYTSPGGSVSMTTARVDDRVVVRVSDTGVGIPPDDLPYIFERFYRSDASRSKDTGGFGLGLAIAKLAIESSGGTIEVVSALDEGTTFTVSLPGAIV